jgi:putative addiction module CopG family antidote
VPTRNVNLTDELGRFVLEKVESGRYEDASEVARAFLHKRMSARNRRSSAFIGGQ